MDEVAVKLKVLERRARQQRRVSVALGAVTILLAVWVIQLRGQKPSRVISLDVLNVHTIYARTIRIHDPKSDGETLLSSFGLVVTRPPPQGERDDGAATRAGFGQQSNVFLGLGEGGRPEFVMSWPRGDGDQGPSAVIGSSQAGDVQARIRDRSGRPISWNSE